MFSQLSLDSFIKLQIENKINANQTIIIDVFKSVNHQPLGCRDVMNILGWSDPNRVRPRVNELVKIGRLVLVGTKVDLTTNRTVGVYGLSEDYHLFNGD